MNQPSSRSLPDRFIASASHARRDPANDNNAPDPPPAVGAGIPRNWSAMNLEAVTAIGLAA